MLGRDNVLSEVVEQTRRVLPAGIQNRLPVGQIPAGILISAGIWALPDSANGYTAAGIPAGYPGILLAGCSSTRHTAQTTSVQVAMRLMRF